MKISIRVTSPFSIVYIGVSLKSIVKNYNLRLQAQNLLKFYNKPSSDCDGDKARVRGFN